MNSDQSRFERRRQETHQNLIQAAVELILEKGYAEVTIQDITDRADYARATFYLHFEDIESLIWEYVNSGWEEHAARAQDLHQDSEQDKPLLYYEILEDFLLAEQNRDFYRIIFSASGPAFVGEQTQKLLIQEIEARIDKYPELSDSTIPKSLRAHFTFGAMQQTISWWLENPGQLSAHDMAEKVLRMLVPQ